LPGSGTTGKLLVDRVTNTAQHPPSPGPATPLEQFRELTAELLLVGVATMVGMLLVFALVWLGPLDPNKTAAGAMLGGPVLLGTAAWSYWRLVQLRDEPFKPLVPRAGKPPATLASGLAIALTGVLAASGGSMLLSLLQQFALSTEVEEQQAILSLVERGDPFELAILAISAVVLAPITEELLFRGMFFRRLLQRVGPIAAWTLPALAFGLSHGNMVGLAIYMWLGTVFALVYAYSGRVWVAIVVHAGHNAFTLTLLLLAPAV
jgi:membrane protease YdiL (CAAX protease family)